MKKFLSLVLAMIMTMSLVTISAGATEYKDLTDKDEIKYEEAVAVLNRIGVITGYSDGSFQPETELTRGAAAKIIVSLMIGPDAAAALPNTSSPYPDVPAGHTFAGVIGFCKTKGYISGYGDGNFKPAGTLTGYAFAKMLLGALGYSSDIERFTGAGWTMNVANIGNVAGLFDRISFDGAAAVTRDEACQLALNTLKATMVTYGGTSVVNGSTGSYTIQGTQATPRTSNNRDINANIGRKDWYGGNNQGSDYLTLEFGEEHFKDLRLEHDRYDPAHDEFGRPSNEWSYKKVTIGTFPLPADFTYTTQVAHIEDTDGTKEKALGLRNYDLVADGGYSIWKGWDSSTDNERPSILDDYTTTLWQNGQEIEEFFDKKKVADIADFTDNGTLVEVYVSYVDADWITDVVVVQTQMMEVKKIGSDYVSLDKVDPDANKTPIAPTVADGKAANVGFNLSPIHVSIEQVKDTNEDCYNILKDLKSGDKVAVVPVTTDDGKTWEAAEVYVPETVSGTLTQVDTYGIGGGDKERGSIEITVGGTSYKIADWNKDMWSLKAEDIKATRKDVTLHMDKYGNALLIEDVGATNSFMVIGNFYQALVGNKVCTFVHGWDIGGDEVDLNLGSSLKSVNHGGVQSIGGHVIGELVHYTSNGANGDADYVLTHHSADTKDGRWTKAVWDVFTNLNKASNDIQADDDADGYEIKASNLMLPLASLDLDGVTQHDGRYSNDINPTTKLAEHKGTYNEKSFENFYYDKSVKFIYVNYDNVNEEVDSIEFKSGIQNVSNEELREQIMGWASQAAVKDEQVKAVVIKRDSSDANLKNMLYVTKNYGSKEVDKDTNESFFKVQVVMFDEKGVMDDNTHDIYVNKDLKIGDFASYTKVAGTKHEDNFYRVKTFTRHNANPAALKVVADTAGSVSQVKDEQGKVVKHLLKLTAKDVRSYTGKTLTGIDAGSGAVMHKDSYILGGYRGSSTTVPNTIASAQGVIRTDKAGWLNLTDITKYDDIGNAEELLDIAGNEAKTKANVTLDILLNEAPDSDGFRTAYLIVIHDVAPVSDGAIDDSGKDVRCSVTGYGVVSGKGTIYAAGKQLDTITVAAPAWAFVNADGKESGSTSSALKSITWTKYNADGLPYAAAADRTITLGSGTSAGQAVYADGKYTVQMGGISMKEGDYVTISKIEWVEAKVEYTLNGKDVTSAMAATTTRAIKVGVNSSLTFNAGVSGTPAGTFTVTGVKDAENYVNLSSTNINSGPASTISTIQALGGETVKVAITSANATQEFTVAVSDSTPNLSAPAAIKTYITGSGAGDAETATLKVEVLRGATPGQTASIKDSGTAVFPVTITAPQDPRVASYIITLELTMADGVTTKTLDPITLDKNTLTKNAVWQGVNSSATVTGVKITAVTQPSATAAESDAGGDSITVNFSGKVTSVDISKVQVFKTDGTPVTPNSATAVGNSVVITVTGPVEAGWTAIIAGDGVVVEAPATTSFALANANNGIALFTDPAIADDALVYVVTLAAASGDKLAGKVEVMTYEEAKPEEQPGGPGGSDQPGTPADITVTFEGTPSGWDLPETKTVTVKAGQSATIDLTASANGEVTEGTTYTAAGTVGGQSATLTAPLKTASTAESKAVVTVSYEVPGGATEAITVTITSVTAGASAGQ